jgi:myo-inositol-1(or 4)-monophosphatase
MPRSALLNVMTSAALKAGKAVLRDFSELDKLQVSRKGTADFATTADRKAEKILHQELSKARPDFGFLMEESGEIEGKDGIHRFVIDPIDGTHNFIHAVPYFCVSLALEKKLPSGRYETLAGVIYDPIHNELFAAELYQGAFMNDQRMQVSGRSEPDTCMIATAGLPYGKDAHAERIQAVLRAQPYFLRVSGALALDLAYVAAGRYDGVCYTGYKRWDIAAGALLVREAGGQVTESEASDKTLLFASTPHIHNKLSAALSQA